MSRITDPRIIVPDEIIESKILLLRGKKVILDKDLAYLYQVKPIALRQQVKRNKERFPEDFMFQLSQDETSALLSQNVIPSIQSLGGTLPYAFTEQGVAMLSSVLKSKRAIMANVQIMRTFTKLRELILSNVELKRKIEDMEKKYDYQFQAVFAAIKKLLEPSIKIEPPPEKPRRKIGFHQGHVDISKVKSFNR